MSPYAILVDTLPVFSAISHSHANDHPPRCACIHPMSQEIAAATRICVRNQVPPHLLINYFL